ncbi:MAG: O-acetylhomoserine aminocarboxypropyltransferase/cysteine synthase [Elusimicrobia bacterium]|nr:O-acetylhomoserine aminocarboxypropyltransferase/cysteine synthase [Elusimicrobiota bacterium]
MKGFSTKAVHGPASAKDPHGTLRGPVYDNVAFEFDCAKDMQLSFEGRKLAHSYSRISNPTVSEYEERIRFLADAAGVVAVSSGMAAIANVFLALAESGAEIVTTRYLFGNTYSLIENTLKPWGLKVVYVDLTDPKKLAAAINERTRAVFLEIITNPQMQVADVDAVARVAHERGVPVVLDGTMTTPCLFKSKDFGVDVEVISSTKYISGGATSVGGLIIDNGLFPWAQRPNLKSWAEKYGPMAFLVRLRREVYRNLGGCLSPHNAWLHTLGLESLDLRVQKSCDNALALARHLEKHPKVRAVNYPGLESSPSHATAKKQFSRGFGGVLTFQLADKAEGFAFMDGLKLIRRATNIHDNKTLVLHPASTIFCEYSAAEKEKMGVPESLVRLSAGIEDVDDLIEDMDSSLRALGGPR